jgi:hypothetical protein
MICCGGALISGDVNVPWSFLEIHQALLDELPEADTANAVVRVVFEKLGNLAVPFEASITIDEDYFQINQPLADEAILAERCERIMRRLNTNGKAVRLRGRVRVENYPKMRKGGIKKTPPASLKKVVVITMSVMDIVKEE